MNNNTFVHKYLSGILHKDMIAADMTCGNGNDTLFLSERVKWVYAFDIAQEAIGNAKKKTEGLKNITFLLEDHLLFDHYLKEADLFIFNLGYLPKSEYYYPTQADNTIKTIQKAYDHLSDKGYLIITIYPGHPEGLEEYEKINIFLSKEGIIPLERYRQYKKAREPETLIIKKNSGGRSSFSK